MSSSIDTKGHHTCKNRGAEKEILKEAPFISGKNSGNVVPFLGEGYYLWDNNIEKARWWGSTHYSNNYKIVEIDLKLSGDNFLDLVGSRQDMINFDQILSRVYSNIGIKLPIGKCIEFLKKTEIFPYNVIRVLDIKQTEKDNVIPLSDTVKCSSINLNPTIIICIIDKSSVDLRCKRLL